MFPKWRKKYLISPCFTVVFPLCLQTRVSSMAHSHYFFKEKSYTVDKTSENTTHWGPLITSHLCDNESRFETVSRITH